MLAVDLLLAWGVLIRASLHIRQVEAVETKNVVGRFINAVEKEKKPAFGGASTVPMMEPRYTGAAPELRRVFSLERDEPEVPTRALLSRGLRGVSPI
jgi:hypothetical protein